MDQPEFYRRLIKNYRDKTATDAELEVLMQLIREGKADQYLLESMNEEAGLEEETPPAAFPSPAARMRKLLPYAAAAVLMLLAFTGLFFYKERLSARNVQQGSGEIMGIRPGGNYATLSLDDGSLITLDSIENDWVIRQAGIVARKTTNGQLIYELKSQATDHQEVSYNTISTPNGGQYRVILSDGTTVWLNATSSLRYPTRFTGESRSVVLTGEAYFEVAPDKNMPFVVECEKQTVRVLGTHFNINAYPDEQSVNTTLLEGRVKVISKDGEKNVELKPGEQASLENGKVKVKNVDTEQVTDWTNGDFIFAGDDIKSVMRKIARWYDVEIAYEKGYHPDTRFNGQVSRSKSISDVLQVLELTGAVNFRIEGRKITVLP